MKRVKVGLRYIRLSKRFFFNRRGYRIHSPYIYHLIHHTILNKYSFYCYSHLDKHYYSSKKIFYQNVKRSICRLTFRLVHDLNLKYTVILSDEKVFRLLSPYIEAANSHVAISDKLLMEDSLPDIIFVDKELDNLSISLCNFIDKASKQNKKRIVLFNIENYNRLQEINKLVSSLDKKASIIHLNYAVLLIISNELTPCKCNLYY